VANQPSYPSACLSLPSLREGTESHLVKDVRFGSLPSFSVMVLLGKLVLEVYHNFGLVMACELLTSLIVLLGLLAYMHRHTI
jgi:hypothetical protein